MTMFESPVARAVFIYWLIAAFSWWVPGWYRIRLGRKGEVGRTWSAAQRNLVEKIHEDVERYHLDLTFILVVFRFILSVGWPIGFVMYLYFFARKQYRLARLRRHRARNR